MTPRELILLSPYKLPAQNSLMLGNDDAAAFLNGCTALWHPAAARGAAGPPRVGSPYDYEQPTAGHVYAVPESPPLMLPDDWDDRVRQAGAVAFRAGEDRRAALDNLKEALRQGGEAFAADAALFDLDADRLAAFFGIGFGYLMVDGLFEAMEHENLIAKADLWQDVQAAIAALNDPDADAWRRHLQSAADRLLSARDVLYPAPIHLLDLCLLDENRLKEPLPASFAHDLPLNLIAPASLLEKWGREQPEQLALLRERVAGEKAEVCGGPYLEREDALLPLDSQLWNLLKGQAAYKELLGLEVRVFARKRFGFHPQTPLLLTSAGLPRAVLLAFDNATVPNYRATTVYWPSADGKQVEAFTRAPHAADSPQTYFHAAHYLRQTIAQDHMATLALLHGSAPAPAWYHDWLALSRFAPVLGQWTTLGKYFADGSPGEYGTVGTADDFHGDYLAERTDRNDAQPVSGFARQVRDRRRLDAAWTLAALGRSLGASDPSWERRLAELEDQVEIAGEARDTPPESAEKEVAEALAGRLLAGAADAPGYLLLNPCGFARRVAVELAGVAHPLPVGGAVKACQLEGGRARLVVEVPGLGFAWLPRSGPPGTPPQASRLKLADPHCVRNEFFEAEIDPQTGGLRALRDHRTRVNRLGQQLVFNPGSLVRLKQVKVTSAGPALGEVVSEGALVDPYQQDQVLATFRQRFRAWLGRPVLEMRIEIYPEHLPQGYPWHSYYGARFAWREERAVLLRGVNGTGYVSNYTRPESPDYLELRAGGQATALLTGGLPFHQRQGARMLDVILLPQGETARAFDLGLALDRDYPMQTALGMVSPAPLVPTVKGPPHVGASGWLFHLDAPNLQLTSMRPAPGGADGVVVRLRECAGFTGHAELRCVRDPRRAVLTDARGEPLMEVSTNGDAAGFEVAQSDLVHLRVEFS